MAGSGKSGLEEKRPGRRRIMGVDPGLASAGWGVIDYVQGRVKYVAHGCIETKAQTPRAERLLFIYLSLKELLETYRPGESAVETLYFGRNVTSAIPVAEARGVISLALAEKGLHVREFTPAQIKQGVVGTARADKVQIQEMVRLILGLSGIPSPDHAADALAAAICCAHSAAG
ncbi:MAG: crossover junction endodeoxyribonuclease RuvC [Treponema sp.]|nr:crossover junction endodeoxyribonuclease RuvC [Treponema sp.]